MIFNKWRQLGLCLFVLLTGATISVLFLSKQGADLALEAPLPSLTQAPLAKSQQAMVTAVPLQPEQFKPLELSQSFGRSDQLSQTEQIQALNALSYFDGQAFQQAVPAQIMQLHQADLTNRRSKASSIQSSAQAKIQAGVVPHHLLAADLIAEFMHTVAEQSQPSLVILLAPNHQELGDSSIQSTVKPWLTAFGQVSGLQTVAPAINLNHGQTGGQQNTWLESTLGATDLRLEPQSVQQEHGVGNLLAYVKYYFPQAAVLPITFKSDASLEQIQALSHALLDLCRAWQQTRQLQPTVLVMASIDFAHQVDQAQAELNQQRVLSLMQAKQYRDLLRLDQHYLDSAPALVTLLLLAEKQGWQRFRGRELHSSQVLQQPYHPGTGYLQLVFVQ